MIAVLLRAVAYVSRERQMRRLVREWKRERLDLNPALRRR